VGFPVSDHIRDAVLAPKSASFAFTPITVLVLLAFIILWLGCGFYGIKDAIQMRAAIMANTPAIYWSSPGSNINLFVFPYLMAPARVGRKSEAPSALFGRRTTAPIHMDPNASLHPSMNKPVDTAPA
jgi:hypothetical protein